MEERESRVCKQPWCRHESAWPTLKPQSRATRKRVARACVTSSGTSRMASATGVCCSSSPSALSLMACASVHARPCGRTAPNVRRQTGVRFYTGADERATRVHSCHDSFVGGREHGPAAHYSWTAGVVQADHGRRCARVCLPGYQSPRGSLRSVRTSSRFQVERRSMDEALCLEGGHDPTQAPVTRGQRALYGARAARNEVQKRAAVGMALPRREDEDGVGAVGSQCGVGVAPEASHCSLQISKRSAGAWSKSRLVLVARA